MGEKIKEIGKRARLDIEKALNSKIFLNLSVILKIIKNAYHR